MKFVLPVPNCCILFFILLTSKLNKTTEIEWTFLKQFCLLLLSLTFKILFKMNSFLYGTVFMKLELLCFFPPAHTPDNSFMGFVTEELNQTERFHIQRDKVNNMAVVYGKEASMWKVRTCASNNSRSKQRFSRWLTEMSRILTHFYHHAV